MARQTQFQQGDRVQVISGSCRDFIGTVRKVHKFGMGRRPFEVDLGDGKVRYFDHGELKAYTDVQPPYGRIAN